ncbi:MAG: flippase-like domain-containing protein [Solirubrobacteraceae bacterium]
MAENVTRQEHHETARGTPDAQVEVVEAQRGAGQPQAGTGETQAGVGETQAGARAVRDDAPQRPPGPAAGPPAGTTQPAIEEEMPRVALTRRRVVGLTLFILAVVAFLYFVLPRLAGVGTAVHHLERGDKWWIAVGIVLELCSFAGYIVLFRAVFVRGPSLIGWRASYQITMAGLAATRLFAAGGAGGVALTAWALRRSGMEPRLVACRMVAFLVLLYSVYMGSLLIDGIGLGTGLFPGGGSFAITIVPAIVAAILLAATGAVAMLPGDVERRLWRWASGSGRLAKWVAAGVTVPALAASGVRTAIELIRSRDPGLLGALAWWGFDIAVLWAMFHAFGTPPPFTVIWMAYFVGMLGNLLPLPGGLGGVEGGMIGAFAAFGVDFNLAVLAVLSYRAISFWMPTPLGIAAYLQLRRTVARWRELQGRPSAERTSGEPVEAAGPAKPAGALQGS